MTILAHQFYDNTTHKYRVTTLSTLVGDLTHKFYDSELDLNEFVHYIKPLTETSEDFIVEVEEFDPSLTDEELNVRHTLSSLERIFMTAGTYDDDSNTVPFTHFYDSLATLDLLAERMSTTVISDIGGILCAKTNNCKLSSYEFSNASYEEDDEYQQFADRVFFCMTSDNKRVYSCEVLNIEHALALITHSK
jgi:hypothetical protein